MDTECLRANVTGTTGSVRDKKALIEIAVKGVKGFWIGGAIEGADMKRRAGRRERDEIGFHVIAELVDIGLIHRRECGVEGGECGGGGSLEIGQRAIGGARDSLEFGIVGADCFCRGGEIG